MNISIHPNHGVSTVEKSNPIDMLSYQKLIDKLTCLSRTIFDIYYVGSVVSQIMHNHR